MTRRAWRLKSWWAGRSPRERVLLAGLGAALGLYLAVALVAQPLVAARAEALAEIGRTDAALARLAALPEDAAPVSPAPLRAVIAILTETAPEFDLAIRRIEPEGSGARLVVEDAGFAEIVLWIEALERKHGLALIALEMDRRPELGTVSARLTLER